MAKRRRKKTSLPARIGERATMERSQHSGGVVTEVMDRDLRGNPFILRDRVVAECPIDLYLWYGKISPAEHAAGQKFAVAYQRAVLRIKVEDPLSSGPYDPEAAMLAVPMSEEILRSAYGVLSEAQKKIVINVCGHGISAGTTDRVDTLRRGLENLARKWKL